MNEAVVLAPDVRSSSLSDLLALVGVPSQRRSSRELLPPSTAAVLKGMASIVDGLLLRVVSAQTKEEFITIRKEVFQQYAFSVTSLARIIKFVVPLDVIERVVGESFCEFEAEFRENGVARFGSETKNQAMFTIWTLRRTSGLIAKLAMQTAIQVNREEDEKLANVFGSYASWAQFHLDCLLFASRNEKSLQLEVLPVIINGLRAAVNAYGYARQGLKLRSPEEELVVQASEWDEEDQELLDSSMRDMESEAIDD